MLEFSTNVNRLPVSPEHTAQLLHFWAVRYWHFVDGSPAGTACRYARAAKDRAANEWPELIAYLEALAGAYPQHKTVINRLIKDAYEISST